MVQTWNQLNWYAIKWFMKMYSYGLRMSKKMPISTLHNKAKDASYDMKIEFLMVVLLWDRYDTLWKHIFEKKKKMQWVTSMQEKLLLYQFLLSF